MTPFDKIRAAIDHYDDGVCKEALSALAELERAAAEPVAWIICKPTHGHDIGRYLAWNAGHVPYSVGTAAEPLYTTPPPAPVAEMREPSDDDCREMWLRCADYDVDVLDKAECGRAMFNAVRAVMGSASHHRIEPEEDLGGMTGAELSGGES